MEGLFLVRAESSPSVSKRNRNSGEHTGGRGKGRSQLSLKIGTKEERMMGAEERRVESERSHWRDSGPRPKLKQEVL